MAGEGFTEDGEGVGVVVCHDAPCASMAAAVASVDPRGTIWNLYPDAMPRAMMRPIIAFCAPTHGQPSPCASWSSEAIITLT